MSRAQRREQLIGIARELFGARGYDAVSIEEIASAAEVSKPVVYEHFGGKEGLYQVIVDREVTQLSEMLSSQMRPGLHPRDMLERIVLSLLDYIESNADGFRLLSHQSPTAVSGGTFTTVIADVAEQVTDLLAPVLEEQGLNPKTAPIYGQLLAGAIGRIGQWWVDVREPSKEETAAHVVNLLWLGLRSMERDPKLTARPSSL
ncbi:TetR family transcriptional regulator [Ancrocorticia populi]|uniref:TetR family transcriptional regulator n=4 Tax=Ancrocorticia populi TaxID=2175228 RepID=A0A2V1KC25_9ACTO|nr:TetR family transcriptional regulator [Ancrocorticia populi]